MWPTLFKIPWLNLPIRGYGLMLMIGFLGGTWWAARRAARVKANPDLVVNVGLIALISSVIGARLFYVIHYWESHFAGKGLWSVINITSGGMEFYGGFIAAVLAVLAYLYLNKVSIRLYFDILAPSIMFGMSMARIGCFLNGCCWGGPCTHEIPWSVRFPYASPAQHRMWEQRQITLPAELIVVNSTGQAFLIPRDLLDMSPEQRSAGDDALRKAEEKLQDAKNKNADRTTLAKLQRACERARQKQQKYQREMWAFNYQVELFKRTPNELDQLAARAQYQTPDMHPAQLYASIDGILLALLLNALFYRRRRHGLVAGLLFVMYPIMRVIEEIVRIDNPHDTAGLTISQFVSLLIFIGGVGFLVMVFRGPLRSPKAVPYVPPWDQPEPKSKKKKHKK